MYGNTITLTKYLVLNPSGQEKNLLELKEKMWSLLCQGIKQLELLPTGLEGKQ